MSVAETLFCFLAGSAVGAVYFGGLWQTIKMLKTTKHTTRVLVVSWLVRNLFFIGSFFLLMQGSAHRLIAAFLGMMAVRAAMTIYMKRKNAGTNEGRS